MTTYSQTPGSDDQILIHAYLDGELDPIAALNIERRLSDDPQLAGERDRVLALREAIQSNIPREPVSPTLRRRIENATGLRRVVSRPSWSALAASVALAIFVTGSSTWFLSGSKHALSTEGAILDGHIRALMAPQPADVPSTDSHTVKPWFNGRVPEAPHVVDLSKAGFPLVGGRIDVVNGTPAPTLVYRRRQHVISLTAIPARGSANSAPTASAENGYNIVQWVAKGVSYWAVSDVSAADLNEFAKLFGASLS